MCSLVTMNDLQRCTADACRYLCMYSLGYGYQTMMSLNNIMKHLK